MGWFTKSINKGVQQGVATALRDFMKPGGRLDKIIEDHVWQRAGELPLDQPLTATGFVWALRACFVKHGCTRQEAISYANSTLTQYLTDEKIKFGDGCYGWTRYDAEEIADEYEFRHWESAA